MRYKALAVRLRQATETTDPKPTAALLDETPRHELVATLLAEPDPVFTHVFAALERALSPETVFLDPAKPRENFPQRILKDDSRKTRNAGKSGARTDRMRAGTRSQDEEAACRRRRSAGCAAHEAPAGERKSLGIHAWRVGSNGST